MTGRSRATVHHYSPEVSACCHLGGRVFLFDDAIASQVSIGSDAVYAAEAYIASGGAKTGATCIETISYAYGAQAVVISVDPRRVYVADPASVTHKTIETKVPGPNGETHCWYVRVDDAFRLGNRGC